MLAEYDLQERARELNLAVAKLAVEAVRKFSTPEWPRYVAGAMGPTTKTLSVIGGVAIDQLVDSYYEQVLVLIEAGIDALMLETSQDTLNVKAGSNAISTGDGDNGAEAAVHDLGHDRADGNNSCRPEH